MLQWLMEHHHLVDVVTKVIAVCSVLHTLLPPYDWDPDWCKDGLVDFPDAQKWVRGCFHNRWYKLLVYVIGYVALNARSTVWAKWISANKQIAAAKATGVKEGITTGIELAQNGTAASNTPENK